MSDLIYRQAAIEEIEEDKIDLDDPKVVAVFKATGDFEKAETQVMTCDRHIKILKDLPSAQPEVMYYPQVDGVTPSVIIQPEPHWIPCSERLPDRIINGDVETVQDFFVTVKERWPGEEWKYHTDVAEFPGDYIDDVWQTYNDWKEGQEVHVIAWMPLPKPYKENNDE